MTNGNNLIIGNHIESVAAESKRYTLSELASVVSAVADELTALSDEFDIKLNQVAAGNVFVLGTVSSVVEGAMWLEV